MMRTLKLLLSRRWWWVTLLVVAGMALLVRLGIWQLDRLEQRRAANDLLRAQLAAAPLDLNDPALEEARLAEMPDRAATVTGEFDFDQQLWLKLQNFNGQTGGHLLAPLLIEGRDDAVLVDRGWVPFRDAAPEQWAQYDEVGTVTVQGVIRRSDPPREVEESATGDGEGVTLRRELFRVDLEAIERQLPYDLLPVYLYQTDDDVQHPPLREEPEVDLSEGPHLSYALQWFTFALMFGVGYLFYVRRAESKADDDT